MAAATIKLFLLKGEAQSLRTAELLNWTGKAVAGPRSELEGLLAREELDKSGVYFLIGTDPETGKPAAYIGEAEVVRDRLKQHRDKEFWVQAMVFVSKDENLTKSHVRYLEGRAGGRGTSGTSNIVQLNGILGGCGGIRLKSIIQQPGQANPAKKAVWCQTCSGSLRSGCSPRRLCILVF